MFKTTATTTHEIRVANNSSIWRGKLFHMERRHQIIWVECTISRSDVISSDTSYSFQQEIVVDATADPWEGLDQITIVENEKHVKNVRCPAGKDSCDPISVFNTHNVLYPTYHVIVTFDHPGEIKKGQGEDTIETMFAMHYVNPSFTNFQIAFKTISCFITLWVMFGPGKGDTAGFFFQLKDTRSSNWTDFQRWIAGLLVMTFFFNDPLFLLEVYLDDGIFITGLYIIFLCSFMSFMLFFWLCLLHECSRQGTPEETKQKGAGFFLWKAIFSSAFFVVLSIIYVTVRMQQQGDPSYDMLEDSHFRLFRRMISLCVFIYFWWFVYHFVNAAKQYSQMKPHFRFVFTITLMSIVLSLFALVTGAMYPLPTGAIGYSTIYGGINCYVWILAWCFAPKSKATARQTEENNGADDVRGLASGERSDDNNNNL